MQRRHVIAALSALPLLSSQAADPPPTRLLVGATTGGGTDIVARALALEMATRLGRPLIVDNRPGAAGNIAALATAKAAPDGSTLLVSYTSHAINASLYPSLPFDPIADFTPLCEIASSPAILVARPTFEADDVRGLIALARQRPGKLNLAIAGIGGANHLAGEMLKHDARINIVSVPYKGTGPALADVIAGQIDMAFAGVATVQQLVKGGKLKALGVTSPQRLPAFPDIAAVAETLPGWSYSSWYGLFGPAHMPDGLVEQIAGAANAAVTSESMRSRLTQEGLVPVGASPQVFQRFVRDEIERWRKVVAATGAKPE